MRPLPRFLPVRRVAVGLVAVATATLGLTALPADAADPPSAPETPPTSATGPAGGGDPSDIDVLRADADQVRAALAATAERRAAAESELAAARAAVTEALAAVDRAEIAERLAASRAERIDGHVREAAVAAYMGNGEPVPLGVLGASSAQDASWETTVLELRAERLERLLERQRAAQRRLENERAATSAAAAKAAESAAASAHRVDELVQTEQRQAVLVSAVDQRLESAIAEADAVAALDAAAANEITERERALSDIARSAPPTTVPPPAPTVPGTPRTTTPSTPRTTAPRTPTTTPAPPPPSPGTTIVVPPVITVDTVVVGGFVVARSLAPSLQAMLDAARAGGIVFGGSGYRNTQTQIDLRRQHCGPTDWDIWFKPSASCSPPTAVPGRSMHEKGLAVDLTCNGLLIRSRDDPCFVWLAANAGGFGLRNLPSEPWHWSTNGN